MNEHICILVYIALNKAEMIYFILIGLVHQTEFCKGKIKIFVFSSHCTSCDVTQQAGVFAFN